MDRAWWRAGTSGERERGRLGPGSGCTDEKRRREEEKKKRRERGPGQKVGVQFGLLSLAEKERERYLGWAKQIEKRERE